MIQLREKKLMIFWKNLIMTHFFDIFNHRLLANEKEACIYQDESFSHDFFLSAITVKKLLDLKIN
jgi:hypothetical protein